MILGIVGPEQSKWTPKGEEIARIWIRTLLTREDITGVTSGHCPKGGVDIWVEEELPDVRLIQDVEAFIYPPKEKSWFYYKLRNIQIANKADEIHVIVPGRPSCPELIMGYCYHCKTHDHIANGGCWSAKYAEKLGKKAFWHVIGG